MRPIDADVVIRNLAVLERENEDFFEYCQEMKSLIRNTPTIEAEPVRHGRWIFKGKSNGRSIYQCSECKNDISGSAAYCKECGAKMDLEESK